jgi:hypothetical protein
MKNNESNKISLGARLIVATGVVVGFTIVEIKGFFLDLKNTGSRVKCAFKKKLNR